MICQLASLLLPPHESRGAQAVVQSLIPPSEQAFVLIAPSSLETRQSEHSNDVWITFLAGTLYAPSGMPKREMGLILAKLTLVYRRMWAAKAVALCVFDCRTSPD